MNFPLSLVLATSLLLPGLRLPTAGPAQEDVVRLIDGEQESGRVVFEDDARVVLRKGSRNVEIGRHEIETVESLERSQAFIFEHALVIPKKSARDLADVARLCEARGLPGLGSLFDYKILLLDPEDEAAHERLGHRKRSKSWTGQLDGRWHRWHELVELRRDWNRAWEFETTHYSLRTNFKLEDAVNAALDLERFFLFFHKILGSALDLRIAQSPLDVHLYGDSNSYIEPGDGRLGWYDSDSQTVKVDGSQRRPRVTLLHEAVHQLLEVGPNGVIDSGSHAPAWVDEGLAVYLSLSAVGDPGRAQFEAGRHSTTHLYAHASAEDPESLDNILALSHSDFWTPKRADLRYAQSYSLVHFCLHGENGRYRSDFLDYVRMTRLGRSSSSSFKKRVAGDPDEFERAWTQYVAGLSGGR